MNVNKFRIAIIMCTLVMITGCFGPSLHEKLNRIETATLMEIDRIDQSVKEEINCAKYSEHNENFVLIMVKKFGVEKVRAVAVSDFAKYSVAQFELHQKEAQYTKNLGKIDQLSPNKIVKKAVKPVQEINGYIFALRESSYSEDDGSFMGLLDYSGYQEYLRYQNAITRESDIECGVDSSSSKCLSHYEYVDKIKDKLMGLSKEIFIKDLSYQSETNISERVPTQVTLINTPYDYNGTDSYILPLFGVQLLMEHEERDKEREIQKRKYKLTVEKNTEEIKQLEIANQKLLGNITEQKEQLSKMAH